MTRTRPDCGHLCKTDCRSLQPLPRGCYSSFDKTSPFTNFRRRQCFWSGVASKPRRRLRTHWSLINAACHFSYRRSSMQTFLLFWLPHLPQSLNGRSWRWNDWCDASLCVFVCPDISFFQLIIFFPSQVICHLLSWLAYKMAENSGKNARHKNTTSCDCLFPLTYSAKLKEPQFNISSVKEENEILLYIFMYIYIYIYIYFSYMCVFFAVKGLLQLSRGFFGIPKLKQTGLFISWGQ